MVAPDDCPINFLIKKNQIAINKEDQRVSRFNKGDRLDWHTHVRANYTNVYYLSLPNKS